MQLKRSSESLQKAGLKHMFKAPKAKHQFMWAYHNIRIAKLYTTAAKSTTDFDQRAHLAQIAIIVYRSLASDAHMRALEKDPNAQQYAGVFIDRTLNRYDKKESKYRARISQLEQLKKGIRP